MRTAESFRLRHLPAPFYHIPLAVCILGVTWNVLDASPLLWIYDILVSVYIYLLPSSSSSALLLVGQTIWITGASSGIGAAVVCELARAQATHVILSARRVEHMKQVVDDCRQQMLQHQSTTSATTITTTFSIIPYDAMKPELTPIVVQQALESTPNHSIDMLILNSGIYQIEPALQTTYDVRNQLFQVNVQSPIELSQELIQQGEWKNNNNKNNNKGGHHPHIVAVSSIMSKGPQSLCSTYAATKAALNQYFQTLSTEEWEWLQVTTVLPGATATPMWDHVDSTTGTGSSTAEDTTVGSNKKKVQPDLGGSMTATRVAQLMVRGIALRSASSSWSNFLFRTFLYELWITKPVGLLYAYMSHYTPTLFFYSNHWVALARIHAFQEYRKDLLELPSLVRTLYHLLWSRKEGSSSSLSPSSLS